MLCHRIPVTMMASRCLAWRQAILRHTCKASCTCIERRRQPRGRQIAALDIAVASSKFQSAGEGAVVILLGAAIGTTSPQKPTGTFFGAVCNKKQPPSSLQAWGSVSLLPQT